MVDLVWGSRRFGHWQPLGFVLTAVFLGLLLAFLPLADAGLLLGITAVFLLSLIQPLVGLGLALLLGPLGAWENVLFGATIFDSGQLALLLTVAVWGARGLRNGRLTLLHTHLNLPLALFLFVGTLTLLDAPSLTFGLKELFKWLEIGLIMLMVVDFREQQVVSSHKTAAVSGNCRSLNQEVVFRPSLGSLLAPKWRAAYPWLLVGLLLLSGFAQALIGIWQFGLRGDGPAHFLILGRFYRAFGTFMQPNPFGGFINLTTLLSIGVMLGLLAVVWEQWRCPKRPFWPKRPFFALLIVGFCAIIGTLALVMSWSRGAWLGFAAGLLVLLFFWPRQRWQGGVLLLAGTAVLLLGLSLNLIPAAVTDRLTSFQDDFRLGDVRGVDINDDNYAVLERLAHWQAALDMARGELWLGVGFGNYEPAYDDHALINWPAPLGHAHNYYLNLLAETGVLGLLAYGLFWTAVFWQTLARLSLDWPQRGIVLGLLAAWTALSVHHLVDKLYVNNIYIHIGVMLGLLHCLAPKKDI